MPLLMVVDREDLLGVVNKLQDLVANPPPPPPVMVADIPRSSIPSEQIPVLIFLKS